MSPREALLFGPYRLDTVNGDLWRGEEALALPPKVLAVLCYLAKHPGRLVSKEELLDTVWGHRFVSEAVLKSSVKTIRRVLRDDPKAPSYIETRHRRGYRFIDGTVTKAARVIRFAAGVANIPPGGSGTVSLQLTKQGKRLVRATTKRRLKGVVGIREIATTVSNTPLTISRTDVTIKLKRRK